MAGKIFDGGNKAILVCDRTLGDCEAPFFDWLREEGFTFGGTHGCPGSVCWAYVNINTMTYAYGMPGVCLVPVLGDHAVTIEEFKTIWQIYKKYQGKDVFVFHEKRFDYDGSENDDAEKNVLLSMLHKFVAQPTCDEYWEIVRSERMDCRNYWEVLGDVRKERDFLLTYDPQTPEQARAAFTYVSREARGDYDTRNAPQKYIDNGALQRIVTKYLTWLEK